MAWVSRIVPCMCMRAGPPALAAQPPLPLPWPLQLHPTPPALPCPRRASVPASGGSTYHLMQLAFAISRKCMKLGTPLAHPGAGLPHTCMAKGGRKAFIAHRLSHHQCQHASPGGSPNQKACHRHRESFLCQGRSRQRPTTVPNRPPQTREGVRERIVRERAGGTYAGCFGVALCSTCCVAETPWRHSVRPASAVAPAERQHISFLSPACEPSLAMLDYCRAADDGCSIPPAGSGGDFAAGGRLGLPGHQAT